MPRVLVLFGHHKCGSRFFRNSILEPMAKANKLQVVNYEVTDPPFHFRTCHDLDLKNIDFRTVSKKKAALLMLSNAGRPVRRQILSLMPDFRGLRAIRDPRQVLVSNYFHHRRGHDIESSAGWVWDQLKEDRPILEELSLEDGLLHELDNITGDILTNQLFAWPRDPRLIELKLEEFDIRPDYWIERISEHFGLEQTGDVQLGRRFVNDESQRWQRVLTPRVIDVFKKRHGQLLMDLGYESSLDW